MAKLIMLSGLPASGKSTRAKEIISQGNWIRVNRDLLRTMLHCDKWSGRNEGLTIDAEKSLVDYFLKHGISVVVDDTNLGDKNKQMWHQIADECGAKFETEHIDTHWVECLKRDSQRDKKVGTAVVMNMALQYGLYEKPEKGFVLCDLDGTLCDIKHRLHFVKKPEGEKKDWKSFFEAIPLDTPREETLKLLDEYKSKGHGVVFVSARPDTYRKETEEWIAKHWGPMYVALIMRRGGDNRPDNEVKQDILDRYFKDKYAIEVVIDDRPSVIRMWKENGLNVVDVGGGVEF